VIVNTQKSLQALS